MPRFGLAKPDLLEIWRTDGGGYVWRIIDAKASKDVKVCTIFFVTIPTHSKLFYRIQDFTPCSDLFLPPLSCIYTPPLVYPSPHSSGLASVWHCFIERFVYSNLFSDHPSPNSYSAFGASANGTHLHTPP